MSRTDDVVTRLRAADPAVVAEPTRLGTAALWHRIVATPEDPRLARGARAVSKPRRRRRIRRGAALGCALLAAVGASVAVARVIGIKDPFAFLAHDTPLALFRAAPGYDRHRQPAVVAHSVHLVETVPVPGVGSVEYWAARTGNGWACAAFKLPGGAWAGTAIGASARAGFSGPVPSCHGPWITWEGPDFRYQGLQFVAARRGYGLVYGTVQATRPVIRVRDLASGASTRVVDQTHFALLVPVRDGRIRDVHLEALDASGHAVAAAPIDRVTFGP